MPGAYATNGALAALNDQIDVACDNYDWVTFDASGSFSMTITVTASVDGVTFRAIPLIGIAGAFNSSGQTTGAGSFAIPVTGIKTIRIKATAYTSGTATITANAAAGDGGIAFTQIAGNPVISGATAASSSQTAPFNRHRALSAASDTPTNVKNSATNLAYCYVANDGGTKAFLKFYDKATAPSNADTPVATILLPPGSGQVIVNDALLRHPFTLGLGYRMVGLIADNDNTALAAAQATLNLLYT
jgi:hypothetical protein